jgi:hypothetical protein
VLFHLKKPGHIASQCTQHAEPSTESAAENRSTTNAPISTPIEQAVSDTEASTELPPVGETNKISTKRLGDTLTLSTTKLHPHHPPQRMNHLRSQQSHQHNIQENVQR